MEYQLLGSMEVWHSGTLLALGGVKQRAVLAILLLNADAIVEYDRLIDSVWNDTPPAKAVASLRAYVANLRRVIDADQPGGIGRLETHSYGYRLNLADDYLDIRQFDELAAKGRAALLAGNPALADATFARAIALWRGTPLADFRDHSFADAEVCRLDALRYDVAEARFDAGLLLGRDTELIADIEAQLATSPLHERMWGQLMLAMYRSGRRADALHAYRRACDILESELAVAPGAALQSLADDVRRQSPELDWTPIRTTLRAAPKPPQAPKTVFGRDDESDRLRRLLGAGRHGHVVVLSGESGVGKTMLASAVLDEAAEQSMVTAWSAHPAGISRPALWTWTQVVRSLCSSADPLRLRRAHDIAPGVIAALAPERQQPGTVGEAATGFELIEGTARLICELTTDRPTVVVLDDVHRADKATYDVLELLSGSLHRIPLVIIATWQDGGTDVPLRHKAFDRVLSCTETTLIKLRGIDDDSVAELIRAETSVTPTAELVTQVRARTGGNPFYIRELVRLLRSHGELDATTRTIVIDEVPDAVAGVIRRRTAELPRHTRTALGIGAVVGAVCDAGILAEVLGLDLTSVVDRLAPAVRAGLISDLDVRSGQFRFSHGLVRNAIVGQLSSTTLAAAHADIARVWTRRSADIDYETAIAAADHAWRAGDRIDPESALAHIDRALAFSAARSAYAEIVGLDRRGVELCRRLPDGPQRAEREAALWLQLASASAIVEGQNAPSVVEALHNAFDAGTTQRSTGQFNAGVALRALMVCGAGRYREGGALADGLIAQFQATGDPVAGVAGYYIRAMVAFMQGDLDSSLVALDSLEHTVPPVDIDVVGPMLAFDSRGHVISAWIHALRGDTARGRAYAYAAIDIATTRGDGFGAAVAKVGLIQLDAMIGKVTDTALLAEQIFDDLANAGMDQIAASAHIIGAWARALEPGGDDTSDLIRTALEKHSAGGSRIMTPLYLALLSDVEATHGAGDVARTTLHRAELIATATGERVWDSQLAARKRSLRAADNRARSDTAG
ncbi:AAA family ATPase [Antrihabitans sp. YC3-6]|uniref:AAA family ATPase n=1 Tax=Antrihabitans stalagmiti TaxID=2799499 RepID=A0A934U252_9NOCA|nr:BTAD domain-containing putative transcriptional regulator [Antrihabitans stalagmiti]MBJ8337938.1 AAA family ATPase [Antrihabitans stalagmiti]